MPLILFVAISTYGNDLFSASANIENQDIGNMIELSPSETLIINLGTSNIMINHESLQMLVDKNYKINKDQSLGIKFHEESNTLDFITIDGISFTVSLEEISGAPPNGLGPRLTN